ncbi:exodeoxyribonuclease VII large subunit [Pseudomonadota bacterium]
MQFTADHTQRDIFSVSRLVREARAVLEGSFPLLWLEGEISNFSRPSSGHMYLTLKDEAAQVRCAMFRSKNMHLRFKPENGMHILVRARISLYEARGDFQLIIEHMEEAGQGALQRSFEALKTRLSHEGLFDTAHKKALPKLPEQIGVITSPTGAAIRDIISVLKRRFPSIPLVIYPVAVQGDSAAKEIADAIKLANQRKECDVLLLTRGGGSLEDLWSFNEEVVARAIHASNIPIVSGVGHEIDFTIADFVADLRAPTPSAAAEFVTPDREELAQLVSQRYSRLLNRMQTLLKQSAQETAWLEKRLLQQHPGHQLQAKAQRLDELEQRLTKSMENLLREKSGGLKHMNERLKRHSPLNRLVQLNTQLDYLKQRMQRACIQNIDKKKNQLAVTSRTLNAMSPLATLDRGYAIVQKLPEKEVVTDAAQLQRGDKIQTQLGKGSLLCTVDKTDDQ